MIYMYVVEYYSPIGVRHSTTLTDVISSLQRFVNNNEAKTKKMFVDLEVINIE